MKENLYNIIDLARQLLTDSSDLVSCERLDLFQQICDECVIISKKAEENKHVKNN